MQLIICSDKSSALIQVLGFADKAQKSLKSNFEWLTVECVFCLHQRWVISTAAGEGHSQGLCIGPACLVLLEGICNLLDTNEAIGTLAHPVLLHKKEAPQLPSVCFRIAPVAQAHMQNPLRS